MLLYLAWLLRTSGPPVNMSPQQSLVLLLVGMIWGLGHVFEGKLYFTKDIVDDSFVPRNRKPKPIPKPEAKPALKGKHVQLFKMRRKVGKGFYSTAPDGPDGQ